MQITDFHMHPWLDQSQNLVFYPNTVPDSPLGMKKHLLDNGVTHACGSVISHDKSVSMRRLNDMALELRDILDADFYTPGFHIHPGHVEESLEEIERMHEQGVKLIGEVVPYFHGWNRFSAWDCIDELNVILDAAQKHGMVFSYHTITDWPLEPVIAAHPDMVFVAAHPGDRGVIPMHVERMKKFPNVYLDLSGTGIFRFGVIRHLVDQVGADRILFGTDYPICNPEMYVHAVLGERLGDEATRMIFHDNAARLLGL